MNNLNAINRRHFFGRGATGLGTAALASLLNPDLFAAREQSRNAIGGLESMPHFAAKAKRVIWMFQSGGPSQLDLFDYKPQLQERFGQEVPTSVYPADRKTTMTAGQTSFPTAPSRLKFKRHGQCGTYVSEVLPNIAKIADDICVVKSMYTEAINHDPAITFYQTGSQIPGRPSIGAWMTYGLGSENANLPGFVAMTSRGSAKAGQPLYDRLWGSGFLPAKYQGVKFRGQGDPVLDINNPPGVDSETRRKMLNALGKLNELQHTEAGDPEIRTRIAQYELAFRMQTSVPELLDLSDEPEHITSMYGKDAKQPGKYAYNCLIARRLAERGVRFIQLFHMGWDQHGNLPTQIRAQGRDTDQASAALVKDLKQRGMLEDTLIVWGGEFGRTVYSQGGLTNKSYGRDHHPNCMSYWLAGAGIKPGLSYGETDDYSVNAVVDRVHVHDLQATILHQMGIDHERLTYKYQGRHFRLTDVHGKVVRDILA
ncbi:MAG: DUF1501 domain-containing protein [Planctomycetes bacterium]|nr:DUF1501 domain-containing protein [Planctomycetota bacterium]